MMACGSRRFRKTRPSRGCDNPVDIAWVQAPTLPATGAFAMRANDPLSEFGEALRTTVGWVALIAGTMVAGTWLGMWIAAGELPGLVDALSAVGASFVACLFLPRIWFALLVALLAIYVPLKAESVWLYITAPIVNRCVFTALESALGDLGDYGLR